MSSSHLTWRSSLSVYFTTSCTRKSFVLVEYYYMNRLCIPAKKISKKFFATRKETMKLSNSKSISKVVRGGSSYSLNTSS